MNHIKKYVVFRLNDFQYAVPLSDVKEVIGLPSVVPVPQSPNFLLGLINLRGKVISAIDLKKKLDMPRHVDQIKRPAVILVDGQSTTIGCVVDSIQEVLSIREEDIERSVQENVPVKKTFIEGIARFDDKPMILLLDLKRVIDLAELDRSGAATLTA